MDDNAPTQQYMYSLLKQNPGTGYTLYIQYYTILNISSKLIRDVYTHVDGQTKTGIQIESTDGCTRTLG